MKGIIVTTDCEVRVEDFDDPLYKTVGSAVDGYIEHVHPMRLVYPAVDVMQELRKMSSWSTDNPKKRKTKGGIRRFINAWLSKEQDKGGRYRYQGSGASGNVFTDIAEGMRNGQA